MMEAFKIENINLSYGEKHVLKNVSIDLYKNHESWKTYKDYIFAME